MEEDIVPSDKKKGWLGVGHPFYRVYFKRCLGGRPFKRGLLQRANEEVDMIIAFNLCFICELFHKPVSLCKKL